MIPASAEELKVFRDCLDMKNGDFFHLRFGPLDLYLQKNEVELVVKWATSNDWLDGSFRYEYPFEGRLPENLVQTKRFTFKRSIPTLRIVPCLGEKPFVVKPDTQLIILPGEVTKIFMSTPMSVRIIDEKTSQEIAEIPVMDRVETWFGESPTQGQICFFTRIFAALSEEALPFRPHRAMTHVHITNRSKKAIHLKRLKIPVTYFSLFQSQNGRFLTSSLEVQCDVKGQVREVKVRPPKTNIKELYKVSPPRQKASKSLLIKSITELMR